MSLLDLQHIHQKIKDKLFELSYRIACFNDAGDTDISRYVEIYFKTLFNIIFNDKGWKFEKSIKVNQDTYDLFDEKNQVCIQITSNNRSSKKSYTIKQFQNKQYPKYKTLIILFITGKKPKNNVSFIVDFTYIDYDISDFSSLIEQCSNDDLLKIRDILFFNYDVRKKRFELLMTFSEWSAYVQRSVNFVITNTSKTLLNLIKNSLSPGSCIRIVGLPGTGKTRTVYETLIMASDSEATLPISQVVLFYDAQGENAPRLADILHRLTTTHERFIFVVDNASITLHHQLATVVGRAGCQSSLITIAPTLDTEYPSDRITRVVELSESTVSEVCYEILQQKFISLDAFTITQVVKHMGAFPALAVLLTQKEKLNIYSLRDLTPGNWIDRLLGPAEQQSEARAVLQMLSLFSEVGYERGEEKEAQWIANQDVFNMLSGSSTQRWQKTKQIIDFYRRRGIINTLGRNIRVFPPPLSLRLAEEWWQSKNTTDALEIFDLLSQYPSLENQFFIQFRHLRGSSNVQDIVRGLCGFNGYFTHPEHVISTKGSFLLHVFSEIDSLSVADCLVRVLLTAPISILTKTEDGHRYLVLILQKLCRYETYFASAGQILMRLAIAENENINNKARGQFLQLFKIQLSGTEALFQTRIDLLEDGKSKYEEAYDLLVLQACQAALAYKSFSRIIDPDEGLTEWKEFSPTFQDIQWYWQQIINFLSIYAFSDHIYAVKAADILLGSLRGMASYRSTQLILSIINKLIADDKVKLKNVRSVIKAALHEGDLKPDERQQLQKLLTEIQPGTLEEKLVLYVYSFVDMTDFRNMDKEALQARAENLVPEFILRRDLWAKVAVDLLNAEHPFYTSAFARLLAGKLSVQNQQWFIDFWFTYLKKETTNVKDISPIANFLVSAGELMTDHFLKRLSLDDELLYLTFRFTPICTSKAEHLEALLILVEEKKQPVTAFYHLQYSKLFIEAANELVEKWLERIAHMGSEGLWVALALTWNYIYGRFDDDEQQQNERKEYFKPLIQKWSLAEELPKTQGDHETQRRWSDELTQIIEQTDEVSTALTCYNQIACYLVNQPDHFPSYAIDQAYQPLRTLLSKFFKVVWPKLGELFKIEDFNYIFRELLGSKSESDREIEGMLFEVGDTDTLLEWYSKQEKTVQLRFARMLPVVNGEVSENITWHPFTHKMLDRFGSDDLMRAEIVTRMNTFGVNGSAASIFQTYLILFEQLFQHKLPVIKAWSRRQADICRNRVQWERDWSEEGFPLN